MAALKRPEVAARIVELGAVPRANAPEEFSRQIGAELENGGRWRNAPTFPWRRDGILSS
ncbi:hypothetical protein WJ966_27385 [Achromobacter xylosoxidans]